ncbi:AfsR/SARP family transcriptional regulator [Nonomuraea jiangxiensis]|uniref:DNA-binding transcriptional activator of the SARP family n=1 Tax=Nonomuraea jiangxiensis TaxID=633440 RepID=A0A1G8RI67_9ACTN|nr:BTAD domain-containing putative transcriptional regulator [Nonomuraea jiangxiensis]SDJ16563.1 DNA-binding transcriptional activator of the SARP family [Nonomuraea jiangxiensis]
MSDGLFIRLLGAVTGEHRRGAVEEFIDLGPARQQATLAILASAAARPVPMTQLVAGLWGQDAPRNAEQSVYTYVAGLRRAFEPARKRREPSRLLAGTAAGYVLCLEPTQVDALLFAQRLGEAGSSRLAGDDLQAVRHLDESLAMWRGTALSGLSGPFAERERARLEQLRLSAFEQRAESLLRLGRHHEITEELYDLTRRHPLRERVRELLMTALLRSGRRAEALDAYDEGRRLLAEELGLSPGAGLRECHQMVLRAQAAPPRQAPQPSATPRAPLPHQLPRPLAGFVGRTREIVRLKGHLAPWDASPPSPLTIISGPPGVGKSALALQVAHQVQDRFPDGRLYVNCRGATPELPALTALEVLGRFLRALGVAAGSVPADLDEAAAVWRGHLHGRRVLALLDDAADLAQIRPLLAVPHGSALLVTSRESMAWGEDACQVELGRMSPAESATMLAKLAGVVRVSADTDATARLVRLCEGLPLALRISGARLAGRPDWSVSALADRLSDERRRLHELAAGDLAVRSSLAASRTALERGARPVDRLAAHTLSLLGLLHVPEVTAEAAGALLGAPEAEAEPALERLVDAHLLDRADGDRYQLHDLVRLFASELRPDGSRDALIRALSYYAASARLASHVSDPHRTQLASPVDAAPHAVATAEEARAWLLKEEAVLTAAALQALNSPDETIARLGVNLAFGLVWHQEWAHRMAAAKELNTLVLRVSERLGDEASALLAHDRIANALRLTDRTDEAVAHLQAELELARRLGDSFGEMRALGNLSSTSNSGERHEEALAWAERQLVLARRIGAHVGVRYALMAMGAAQLGSGRPGRARETLREALAEAEKVGDAGHQAWVRLLLGETCLDLDDPEQALDHFHRALELFGPNGYRLGRLRCLIGLSRTYRRLGDLGRALFHITDAAVSFRGLGHRRWERLLAEEQAAVHAARGSAPVHYV